MPIEEDNSHSDKAEHLSGQRNLGPLYTHKKVKSRYWGHLHTSRRKGRTDLEFVEEVVEGGEGGVWGAPQVLLEPEDG
jgi:hypothetical protein